MNNESFNGIPIPWASNHRSTALSTCDRAILRSPKDPENPYGQFDMRMLCDPRLLDHHKGILVGLLKLSDNWEFLALTKQVMFGSDCNEATARKHINFLIDMGYIHHVVYPEQRGLGVTVLVHRYKISELPMRPEPGTDPREPVVIEGLGVSRAKNLGFPGFHSKPLATLACPIKIKDMLPKKGLSFAAGFAARRSNSGIKICRTNKERSLKMILNTESIPKSHAGTSFQIFEEDCTEPTVSLPDEFSGLIPATDPAPSREPEVKKVAQSTVAKQSPAAKRPATPRKPRKLRSVPNGKINFATFNRERNSAPQGEALADYLTNYPTMHPAAVEAIAGLGTVGTWDWAHTLLTNPLVGMLQELTGKDFLDYNDLRKFGRRLHRGTILPEQVVLMWTTMQTGCDAPFWHELMARLSAPRLRKSGGLRKSEYESRDVTDYSWVDLLDLCRGFITGCVTTALSVCRTSFIRDDYSQCRDVRDKNYDITNRAAIWAQNGDRRFFDDPAATVWLTKSLEHTPLFWAAMAPSLRDSDMPAEQLAEVRESVKSTTPEQLSRWAEGLLCGMPMLPGGVTAELLRDMQFTNGWGLAPEIAHTIACALADQLPESQVDHLDMRSLFDVSAA
jgi:hypothetical protein